MKDEAGTMTMQVREGGSYAIRPGDGDPALPEPAPEKPGEDRTPVAGSSEKEGESGHADA